MSQEGRQVQKLAKFTDVIYGWPLKLGYVFFGQRIFPLAKRKIFKIHAFNRRTGDDHPVNALFKFGFFFHFEQVLPRRTEIKKCTAS